MAGENRNKVEVLLEGKKKVFLENIADQLGIGLYSELKKGRKKKADELRSEILYRWDTDPETVEYLLFGPEKGWTETKSAKSIAWIIGPIALLVGVISLIGDRGERVRKLDEIRVQRTLLEQEISRLESKANRLVGGIHGAINVAEDSYENNSEIQNLTSTLEGMIDEFEQTFHSISLSRYEEIELRLSKAVASNSRRDFSETLELLSVSDEMYEEAKLEAQKKLAMDVIRSRAIAHYGMRNWHLALRGYEKILKYEPRDQSAVLYASICFSHIGQSGKAISLVNRMIEQLPDKIASQEDADFKSYVYYLRGVFQSTAGDVQLAIDDLKESISISKQYPNEDVDFYNVQVLVEKYSRLAYAYSTLGNHQEEAEAAFDQAVRSNEIAADERNKSEVDGLNAKIYFLRGKSSKMAGKLELATQDFIKSVRIINGKLWLNFNETQFLGETFIHLGQISRKREKFDEARNFFDDARRVFEQLGAKGTNVDWDLSLCHRELAIVLSNLNEYSAARAEFSKAVSILSASNGEDSVRKRTERVLSLIERSNLEFKVGRIAAAEKDVEDVLRDCEWILRQDATNPASKMLLANSLGLKAKILRETGQIVPSKECLDRAIKLYPDHETIAGVSSEIYRLANLYIDRGVCWYLLGNNVDSRRDFAEGESHLSRIIRNGEADFLPMKLAALLGQAQLDAREAKYNDAKKRHNLAIEYVEKIATFGEELSKDLQANVFRDRGKLHAKTGSFDEAISDFNVAKAHFEEAARDEKLASYKGEVADLLVEKGRALALTFKFEQAAGCFQEADAILRRLLAQGQSHWKVTLGNLYFYQGHLTISDR